MNFSRRSFVKLGGAAAVASFGFSGLAFGQTKDDVLTKMTSGSFQRLTGSKFYITGNNISAPATLINVKDFPNKPDKGESYSLEFQVSVRNLREGIYQVWHPELGNFDLFMTGGKSGKRSFLIATITRI